MFLLSFFLLCLRSDGNPYICVLGDCCVEWVLVKSFLIRYVKIRGFICSATKVQFAVKLAKNDSCFYENTLERWLDCSCNRFCETIYSDCSYTPWLDLVELPRFGYYAMIISGCKNFKEIFSRFIIRIDTLLMVKHNEESKQALFQIIHWSDQVISQI